MMKSPIPERTAPPTDHAVSDPAAALYGNHDEPVGEAPLHAKVRLARDAEADSAEPADRKRGMPDLQASRLSPPVLLVLAAGALALIVVLVIFGGLV